MNIRNMIIPIIVGVLVLFIYFLPTIIAYKRKLENQQKILWVNLLFGATAIGWVLALSWSLEKSVLKNK